jgi:S-adenosylmethionine hydrolase
VVSPPDRPFISLTTDFGAAYTGICAGVIARIAPGAQVLVLSDEVTKYAIVEGALLLGQALPYFPVGVHVAVVDPGVGTTRRSVAVRTGRGDVLIGPDNGLLAPAADRLGGAVDVHALENPDLRLPATSSTFHGRDIFAPAAAHVANGVELASFGPAIELSSLDLPAPVIGAGELMASVLYPDDFGSLILSARPEDLRVALGDVAHVVISGTPIAYAATFGSVGPGEPLLFTDSSGWLALAINQGSAADRFGLTTGSTVTVRSV